MYDVVIIGAGAAGLTAAIYACRANKKVLVLEAKAYGGQIITTFNIENYPAAPHISGVDFAKQLYNQATELGAEIEFEEVTGLKDHGEYKEVITDDDTYRTKTVIIAVGSEDKKLGIEREEQLTGRGVAYCATCDGALYKGKDVAVVGGGNTALYDALYLCDVVDKVYLIHRRDTFRGDAALVDKLRTKQNLEFVLESNVTKLIGDKKLEAIEVTNKNGETREINVSGLFVAVGRTPATKAFADLIELDDGGYIKSDESCTTNVPGIFVAGDTRNKNVRQLVTATSDGAVAATAAVRFLSD